MTRSEVIDALFLKGHEVNKLMNLKDKQLIQLYNSTYDENVKKLKKEY
jgi:hypothetical protein